MTAMLSMNQLGEPRPPIPDGMANLSGVLVTGGLVIEGCIIKADVVEGCAVDEFVADVGAIV